MLRKSDIRHQTSDTKEIRVRIAPSPTGPFHLGTARTALFNWLFARQNDGKFILRIEDTDKERSDPKWEKEITEGLLWLGLEWDEGPALATSNRQLATGKSKSRSAEKPEARSWKPDYGPYRQSERTGIYKKYLEKLLADGHAYYCCCTKEDLEAERQAMIAQGLPAKYGGHCRNLTEPPADKTPQVIRFKTPEAVVEFKDIIRGEVKFDASLFGDMVIAKDLETPLFNFAGVVDDYEMKITHVIRGEDHLPNTPKQILLQKALGFPQPEYAHLPLILSADRSKLSKRYAETSLFDYRSQGYLPEAIINFLALLGWHPKGDKEFLTRDELVKEFNLRRAQKAGAVFNLEKLDWLQKEHIKMISADDLADRILPYLSAKSISADKEFVKKIIAIEKARMKTVEGFTDLAGFFFNLPDYDARLLIWQKESAAKVKEVLENSFAAIKNVSESDFKRAVLEPIMRKLGAQSGNGLVFWPLRVALSGQASSPDPLDIMEILGKKESERRMEIALDKLGKFII